MKKLLFVDDEPRVLQGLQRQLRGMRQEWDMHFVEGGRQALAFLSTQPVDIIVTDMMMPGMDGSQLLGEVLQRHPQTVRIILSGHAGSEAILRLVGPAHQYLSKPCDADELRKAITRAFSLRDLLGNDRLKLLTTRIKNLPTRPKVENKLNLELRKDSPSMERIGEIISHDLGLTVKILQLVNSAFFGLPQPVNNPMEAVVYLGLNTVRSLLLSVEIFSRYDPQLCPLFSIEALSQHSWLTARMARCLAHAERQDIKIIEQCFLAGLLHDIGQLILAFGLQAEYSEVIAKAKNDNLPVWQVEQEFFGASHADVGAYLLALWGLPDPIVEAVAMHHQPSRCAELEYSPAIAIHAADVFTHEFSQTDNETPPPQLDMAYLTRLGLADRIEAWRTVCQEALKT